MDGKLYNGDDSHWHYMFVADMNDLVMNKFLRSRIKKLKIRISGDKQHVWLESLIIHYVSGMLWAPTGSC